MTRLIDRTEKIHKNFSTYGQNKGWIEKKLKEGKWEQIRDISKKSSPAPAPDVEPEIPTNLLSPKRHIPAESGKGKRIKYPNPKYNDSASPDFENLNLNIPATLNFDTLGLEDDDNEDENFEPETKMQPKPKRKRLRLQETILAGERCGLTDYEIVMMYNAGSK